MSNNDEEMVQSIINLVKRIQRIETRLAIVEAMLKIKSPDEQPSEASKWSEWARKFIWFIVGTLLGWIAKILLETRPAPS